MRYDPFDLYTPWVVSFSGGRTSGLMLRRIEDAAGGSVPPGCHVVFCNTGKERPETLDFVQEVSQRWSVPITWLEYRYESGQHTYAVVDYATASRRGEPFGQVIQARGYPPNRVARFCTAELKVKTMWRWAADHGLTRYTKAVGLRADEPERVRRLLSGVGDARTSEDIVCPLAEAGITLSDVVEFWKAQSFDLALRPDEGNCDLCFLKRRGVLLRILEERPDLAEWWVAQESGGRLFRVPKDRPRYELLLAQARQPGLFDGIEEADDMECACTD